MEQELIINENKNKNKLIQKVYKGNGGKAMLLTLSNQIRDKLNLKKGDSAIVFANEYFATIEKGSLEEPEANRVTIKIMQGSREGLLIMNVPAIMRRKLKLQNGDNVVLTISDCGIVIVEKVEL